MLYEQQQYCANVRYLSSISAGFSKCLPTISPNRRNLGASNVTNASSVAKKSLTIGNLYPEEKQTTDLTTDVDGIYLIQTRYKTDALRLQVVRSQKKEQKLICSLIAMAKKSCIKIERYPGLSPR